MADWFNSTWKSKAQARWAEWNADKEDTSAYWAEKIPNINELESYSNSEVVSIVSEILYPGMSLDYREHKEIAEIHQVITHFRTMKIKLGSLSIGPNVRGENVPGYEGLLSYKWDYSYEREEWDWDDYNDFRTSSYSSAVIPQTNVNGPITRRNNFYGASFDEYPLFMAARRNAERAILRSFVVDDYMKEELPKRVASFVEKAESIETLGQVYKDVIDLASTDQFILSLNDRQLTHLLVYLPSVLNSMTQLNRLMSSSMIWELHQKPANLLKLRDLINVKIVTSE